MNRFHNLRKGLFVLIIVLIITSIYIPSVSADIGPKPSLDIIVRGIDTDEYWLDLLIKDDAKHSWLEITEEERVAVSKLAEYVDEEGFHPALLGGTKVPLNGTLKGEKQSDGSYLHRFSYIGVPELFKIAILRKDGTLIVSDKVQRKQFQSVMEYDLRNLNVREDLSISAGKVSEKIPWSNILTGFTVRLILTLLIEILIALMFGFTLKKSLKILLITNIATQIILNIIVLFSDSSYGLLVAVMTFIFTEILIIITEAIVYSRFLTEKSKARRVAYAVFANLISIIAGFMLFFIS